VSVARAGERRDGKQPYRFRRKDLEPFAFAGIWESARLNGQEILSAAMILGEPNLLVGGVHHRMPVMLLPEDYDAWLGSMTPPRICETYCGPTMKA
jgi:putative SOS response-associated peptidase YedK